MPVMGKKVTRRPPDGGGGEGSIDRNQVKRPRRNLKVPARLRDQIVETQPEDVKVEDVANDAVDVNFEILKSDVDSGDDIDESQNGDVDSDESGSFDDGGELVSGRPAKEAWVGTSSELGKSCEATESNGYSGGSDQDKKRTVRVRKCKAQRKPTVNNSSSVGMQQEAGDSIETVAHPELEAEVEAAGEVPEKMESDGQNDRVSEQGKNATCKKCHKNFSSKHALASHRRRSNCSAPAQRRRKEERKKCIFCRTTFLTKLDRDTHHRVEHQEKKSYPCPMCGRVFGESSHCKRHILSHTGERPYSCDVCGKEFADNSYIRRHMLIHTGHKPFQCDQCGRTFREKTHLSRHTETHRKEEDLCDSCGKAIRGEVNRCTCMERTRSAPLASEKNFTCGECGKGFMKEGNFQRHLVEHERESPEVPGFACDVCNKVFKQERHLQRHQRIHTGDKPFNCTVCGKQFRDASYIRRHMRIHAGHKPFQCDVCDRTFRENGHLARHMLTHTGEKRFSCSTCGKGYQDKTCLLRHEAQCIASFVIEGGKVPELCDICGKEYINKASLRRHQLMHARQKNFPCTKCPAEFFDKTSLRRHLSIHDRDQRSLNQCWHCQRLFRTQRALSNHMTCHMRKTTVDRFQCTLCGGEFPNHGALTAHAASHQGEVLPVKLEIVDEDGDEMPPALSIDLECKFCHKLFASPSILANHEISHVQSLLGDLSKQTAVTMASSSTSRQLSTDMPPALLDSSGTTTSDDFEGLFKLLQVIAQANQGQTVIRSAGNVIDVAVTASVPLADSVSLATDGDNEVQTNVVQVERVMPIIDAMSLASAINAGSSSQYTVSGGSDAPTVIRLVDLVAADATEPPQQVAEALSPPPAEIDDSEPTDEVVQDDMEPAVDSLSIEDPNLEDPNFDGAVPSDDEEFGEEFPCQYCTFVSRRDKVLASHMASAHSEIVFARQIPCKRDKEREDRVLQWQCPFCNEVFNVQKNLKEHSCKGVKEKPFKCPHCPMGFPTQPTLKQHLKVHQSDPEYKCSFCEKVFHFKNSLAYHERIHTKEKPFLCQACGKGFMDKSHLRRHEKIHEGVKPYACQICPKRFLERSQLVKHSRIHSGERPYLCSECGKSFADASHLRRHSMLHKDIKEKSHICETCGKGFRVQDGLRSHMKIHMSGSDFLCDFCGKEFAELVMLNRHITCHNKGRPFTCHFCDKQFRTKSSLVKHFRVHTGEQPSCNQHVKTERGSSKKKRQSKLSFCDICGEAFTESPLLEKHVREHGPLNTE